MRPSRLAEPSRIREIQSRVLAALRAPDGLAEPIDRDLFVAPRGGSFERRWAIYRNAYLVRLAEAIENDYPAIERITGHDAFQGLCRRYVMEFPPHSHDIGRAGERLADYLPTDPVTTALPFLPDLARLERALADAMVSADVESLQWEEISGMPVERFATLPLCPAPATVLIESRWPVPSLWLAKDQPNDAIDIALEGHPSVILVTRQGLQPRWRSIDADEHAVARGALEGATPASLLESGAFGETKAASLRLVRALRRVVGYGAFRSLSHSGAADGAPTFKEIP
jgi:hypothetical protein